MGVSPRLFLAAVEAPFFSNNLTTSVRQRNAATLSAVTPSLSKMSGLGFAADQFFGQVHLAIQGGQNNGKRYNLECFCEEFNLAPARRTDACLACPAR